LICFFFFYAWDSTLGGLELSLISGDDLPLGFQPTYSSTIWQREWM